MEILKHKENWKIKYFFWKMYCMLHLLTKLQVFLFKEYIIEFQKQNNKKKKRKI